MADFRYAQFCPLARAAEILGERWTLLVLRELLVGPQRFSDLRRRLPGVSTSVLADRLQALERRGVVTRETLPPPAASSVYALGEAGRALLPAMAGLARWGARWLLPGSDDDFACAEWIPTALALFARTDGTPEHAFDLRVRDAQGEVRCRVSGGPDGARVARHEASLPEADAQLCGAPQVIVRVAAGALTSDAARRRGALALAGDRAVARRLPEQFDFPRPADPQRSGGRSTHLTGA